QQVEITKKIRKYLHDARRDRFNTHNVPIRADRIAEDLGMSVAEVVESANMLAKRHLVERIDEGFGFAPSYRASSNHSYRIFPSASQGKKVPSEQVRVSPQQPKKV